MPTNAFLKRLSETLSASSDKYPLLDIDSMFSEVSIHTIVLSVTQLFCSGKGRYPSCVYVLCTTMIVLKPHNVHTTDNHS